MLRATLQKVYDCEERMVHALNLEFVADFIRGPKSMCFMEGGLHLIGGLGQGGAQTAIQEINIL